MLNIFPQSFASVEQIFSKMEQIKTFLKNQLAKVRLDQLLRIATGLSKEVYYKYFEHFVDELTEQVPK